MNIFSDVSPSGLYVIYDQFHFSSKNHFYEVVSGHANSLSRYNFHKVFHPECCLGLCTIEYFLYAFPYVPFINHIRSFLNE